MKLSDLMDKYGDWHVDLKSVIGNDEIESVTIDLTKPKPKSVWDLKDGDVYYVIDSNGNVPTCYKWIGHGCDEREVGNVFMTKEEAEHEIERRKVETLLLKCGGRRWFKKAPSENYYIWLRQGGGIVISDTSPVLGTIYFDSREQAERAIAEIGEARIKQALFKER